MVVRSALAALTLLLAGACSSPGTAGPPAQASLALRSAAAVPSALPSVGTLEHLRDGRSYWYVPAGRPGPRPLLLVLHGLYLAPQIVEGESHAQLWARAHGTALAYPVGLHLSWNAGAGCCGYAHHVGANDVAYLEAVVADVRRRARIDGRHVGIMGDSLGGMMALRAACAAPVVFRIGAAVGGPLLTRCPRGALIRVRGAHDRTVPAAGGYDKFLDTTLPSLAQERRLLGPHAHERVIVWPGGHKWPQRKDGLDATALIGGALLAL